MNKSPLHPETLARELLVGLRGTESQIHLSRRLGYTFNQVYRWEAGQTRLPWRTYLQVAALKGLDVTAALHRLNGYRGSSDDTVALMQSIVGAASLQEAAARTGLSRFQIGRWLSGGSEPALHQMITMMIALSSRYLEVLERLAPPGSVASLQPLLQRRDRQIEVSYRYPFAGELIGWLRLDRYLETPEPTDTWLAARLGLEPAAVRDALAALGANEVLRSYPDRPDKYEFTGLPIVSTGRDPQRSLRNAAYWLQRSSDTASRIRSSRHKSVFAYLSLPVSSASRHAIVQRSVKFFEDIKRLAADTPQEEIEEVLLLNFALLSTDEDKRAFEPGATDPKF